MSSVNETYFNAPLFDRELTEITVNIEQTPFFLNDRGHPTYLASLGGRNSFNYRVSHQCENDDGKSLRCTFRNFD